MGKTELALEFAHRFASDYDVAWWIPAELPTSATAALAALAGRLGVAQVAEVTAMVAGLFDLLRQRDRWLLVYDNAERPERLAGLLPPGGGGQVLVTSRWSAWGSQATPLRVNVLRREESVAFLASGSGDQAALDALAELLSDLPLALEEAAAYLEETGEGLGEHLELVRGRARELFGLDTVWLRRLYSLFFIELDTDGSTWLGGLQSQRHRVTQQARNLLLVLEQQGRRVRFGRWPTRTSAAAAEARSAWRAPA